MEEFKIKIENFYQIKIKELFQINNIFYFFLNEKKYVLYPYNRNLKQVDLLIKISDELYKKNIKSNIFIRNNQNELFIKYLEQYYVLQQVVDDYQLEMDLPDIISFQKNVIGKDKIKCEWGNLWAKKIDYYEEKIREIGLNKNTTLNVFSYYIGLAENAVTYFNNNCNKNDKLINAVLSHRRIGTPMYYQTFFNPLTYLFDDPIRDIGEYLKSAFFNGNYLKADWDYIVNLEWDKDRYQLLIARLLYPTYFFDILDDFIERDEENSQIIIEMIENSKKYQSVLKDFIIILNQKKAIDLIDWL